MIRNCHKCQLAVCVVCVCLLVEESLSRQFRGFVHNSVVVQQNSIRAHIHHDLEVYGDASSSAIVASGQVDLARAQLMTNRAQSDSRNLIF